MMTENELVERDKNRDIGAELLQAMRDVKTGNWARKRTFALQADGSVLRRVARRDGTVEHETRLTDVCTKHLHTPE
ncbi:MAG: hypothetical protein LBO00_09730 [Zoogloeaceae bacterium]|nr:hypothetical protein [Zoogloeaceae bacterium]